MPTRLYLPSAGTPSVSPTISADWEHSSGIRRPMSTTKGTSALTSTAYTPDAADHLVNGDALHVQFVSGPLQAQTIAAQNVTLVVKGLMAHANNAQFLTWKLFVWTAAGAVGSTILAIRRDATAYTTALINRADGATSTSVTVGDGDRLVLEIGTGGTPTAAGGTQGHNATLRWGENGATDAPLNDTSTSTTENPWLEFADVLLFQPQTTTTVALRGQARISLPSTVRRAVVTWVSLSVPDTSDLAAAASLRTGARVAAATQKTSSATVGLRVAGRLAVTPLAVQASTGTVRLATVGRLALSATRAATLTASVRGTTRLADTATRATAALAAPRLTGRLDEVVTRGTTAIGRAQVATRLATVPRKDGLAVAAVRGATRTRVTQLGAPASESAIVLRAASRLASLSGSRLATGDAAARLAAVLRSVTTANHITETVSLAGVARALTVTTADHLAEVVLATGILLRPAGVLSSRLGVTTVLVQARTSGLLTLRETGGGAQFRTALGAESTAVSEYTFYWPPSERLTPIHLGWAYRGDTLVLPVWQATDQRGNLLSLEGATVWFTAKADLADTDADPLTVQCSTLIGGVEIIDAALGSYQVIVPAGETQQLDDDTRFTFDVQVVTATPTTHTVRIGTFVVVRDVTRSVA